MEPTLPVKVLGRPNHYSSDTSNRRRALGELARSDITLPEQPDLVFGKCTNDTMQETAIMKEHKVTLLPVVRVDVLGRDSRTLKPVHRLANFG